MAAPPPERTVKQAKVAEAPRAAAGEARSEAIGLPDVTERDQLEAWLRRQPPEVSVAIAARAALRTVPMIAAEFEPGKRPADEIATSILLPVFQHTAVAWAAAKFLSRSDSLAGDSPFAVAAQAVRATAATETDTALAITAAIAALNALAAAKVATKGTTGRDDAARYAASAADAVEYSEKAYTVDGGFPRGSLNSDLERIASGATAAELAGEPLWPEGVSFGISQAWERLKETLLSLDEGWEVWTDWYEARLEGRPANVELEVARATIPDEIWQQGPKVVNARIRELIARYEGESPDGAGAVAASETAAAAERPTVWLCQYRRSEAPTLESRLAPGLEEPWRMHPLTPEIVAQEMRHGDPVVVWRTIDKAKPDSGKRSRGGIVATASIAKRDEEMAVGRIRIRIREAFPDEPVPRDEVLEVTRGVSNWPGQVSMTRLGTDGYDDEPEQINALLTRYGRQPLFADQLRPPQPRPRHEVEYVSDRPETARDLLGRAPLAFALAAQINRIWDAQTKDEVRASRWRRLCDALHITRAARPSPQPDEAAFILHIDAPWGGGKTTFANFIGRILNPGAFGLDRSTGEAALLEGLPLDDPKLWKPQYRRRRWHVVQFNAWQHEHVSPPWWNFYEVIRKQCLKSLVHSRPEPPSDDAAGWRHVLAGAWDWLPWEWLRRRGRWLWYKLVEVLWRIWSPATRQAVLTSSLLIGIIVLVYWAELPALLEDLKIGDMKVTTVAALIASGSIGVWIVNAIRSGLSTFVQSVSSSADAATLGEADPLYRFQSHFSWFVRQLREPVLVVVDDLDRCKPEYVVELVRGLLTIFRSPRVVFLLLGDKSWIEAAFAHVHTDMEKAHADGQISFGGRFAEKAIQLSFILPEATEEERNDYLLAVLTGRLPIAGTGDGAIESGARTADGTGAAAAAQAELSGRLAEFERNVRQRFAGTRDTEELVQAKASTRAEIGQLFKGTGDGTAPDLARRFQQAAERTIEVEASFRSSTSEKTEGDIRHGVEPVAPFLPGNPRRIKRIVNMVSAFQESGQIAARIDPLSRKWRQLVLWTVIMSEYPRAWRALVLEESVARDVVGLVRDADRMGTVKLPPLKKNASDADKSRRAAIADIVSNRGLIRLLRGDPFDEAQSGSEEHALDDATLAWLRRLTPLG